MPRHGRKNAGFTLIELLIVIAVMAILAGVILPDGNAGLHDQLEATARILMMDLAYARSLAVTHADEYQITFDLADNAYTLEHSGSNSILDVLPRTPFTDPGDPADRHIVRISELPHVSGSVRIAAVLAGSASPSEVTTIEFGPLGGTTRSEKTTIWFQAGSGAASRYLSVAVNPLTGLATIEGDSFTAKAPSP